MYKTDRTASRTRATAMTAIALFAIGFSGSASALQYSTNQPMLITYQNDYGKWFGCGPVQCTMAGEASKDQVVDYITQDRHGRFRLLGNVGRCNVYQSSGKLESWDTQPDQIANMIRDRC